MRTFNDTPSSFGRINRSPRAGTTVSSTWFSKASPSLAVPKCCRQGKQQAEQVYEGCAGKVTFATFFDIKARMQKAGTDRHILGALLKSRMHVHSRGGLPNSSSSSHFHESCLLLSMSIAAQPFLQAIMHATHCPWQGAALDLILWMKAPIDRHCNH